MWQVRKSYWTPLLYDVCLSFSSFHVNNCLRLIPVKIECCYAHFWKIATTLLQFLVKKHLPMLLIFKWQQKFNYQLTRSRLITSLPVGEHFAQRRVKKVSPRSGVGSGPEDWRRQTRCSIRLHRSQSLKKQANNMGISIHGYYFLGTWPHQANPVKQWFSTGVHVCFTRKM